MATTTRRRKAPPVTDPVLGMRCWLKEIHVLGEAVDLVEAATGRSFTVPIPGLIGRTSLETAQRDQAVWLSIRLGRRPEEK